MSVAENTLSTPKPSGDQKPAAPKGIERRFQEVGARPPSIFPIAVAALGIIAAGGALFFLLGGDPKMKHMTDAVPGEVYSTGVASTAHQAPPPAPVRPAFSVERGAAASFPISTMHETERVGPLLVLTPPLERSALANPARAPGQAPDEFRSEETPFVLTDDEDAGGDPGPDRADAAAAALRSRATSTRPAPRGDLFVQGEPARMLARPDATLAQGTLIAVTLETALQSDLPGPIRGVAAEDVMSFDGVRVLIPRGSRLIGEYRAGLVQGQTRVFAVWTRILRPDGVSVRLEAPALDGEGRMGVAGKRNAHFFSRFGGAVMLSLIDGAITTAAAKANEGDEARIVVETGRDFESAAAIALRNSISIPPTIQVKAGKRLQVFVNRDIDFSGLIDAGLAQ